jgi:hypothetical protein
MNVGSHQDLQMMKLNDIPMTISKNNNLKPRKT